MKRYPGLTLLTVLVVALAGCVVAPSSPPSPSPIVLPTASQLLATLPKVAGGAQLDDVQVVVKDSFSLAGLPVDDVLRELQKERRDAVAVFHWGEDARIGATTVDGIDGARLFEAFVVTWSAPAVIERRQRLVAGTLAWELRVRGGMLTVIYRLGDVVYLAETTDRALLEAILLDMPPHG